MAISAIGLTNLLKNDETPILGLEIGCYAGENASHLLNHFKNLTIYGVDPYQEYVDWNGGLTLHKEDTAESIAKSRLDHFGDRFLLYRKTSDDAVFDFKDNMFDFIFIDGLHTYDQVLKDCENYYSKLKPNGIFSGHDYGAIEGVRRAVDEFSKKINKNVLKMDTDSWYWVK